MRSRQEHQAYVFSDLRQPFLPWRLVPYDGAPIGLDGNKMEPRGVRRGTLSERERRRAAARAKEQDRRISNSI